VLSRFEQAHVQQVWVHNYHKQLSKQGSHDSTP